MGRMTAGPPDLLTTDELVVAGGVTRELLYRWAAQRLIARPTFTDSPTGGLIAVWSRDSLERVRFICKKQREGATPKELADLVRERWFAGH